MLTKLGSNMPTKPMLPFWFSNKPVLTRFAPARPSDSVLSENSYVMESKLCDSKVHPQIKISIKSSFCK